jgi:genome maintenance exonuclease 1
MSTLLSKVRPLPKYEPIRITNPETGERIYTTPLGPAGSVTTILKETSDQSGIEEWREWVGEEKADLICRLASARGTATHLNIENYLLEGIEPKFCFHSTPFWNSIRPVIEPIKKAALLEGQVWHPEGYAGQLDALVYFEDDKEQPTLADWKTAEKPCNALKLYNYKLQVGAYWAAANYVYKDHGLDIQRAVIAIALPSQDAQLVWLDKDELEQCFLHFQARVQRYIFQKGQ